ncbi:MAG: hypothetical protein V2B20_14125 [Pseudomonadota bacterium]
MFTSEQWHEESGSAAMPEISLNLKQLGESEPIDVMATLVRQMVHLWQESYGQPSQKGYYNREWAKKMTEIGLIPSATGQPGGKPTGQTIRHYIENNGRFEQAFRKIPDTCLLPFRPKVLDGEKNKLNKDKEMYQCASCGAKLWGKGGLGAVCECGEELVSETGGPKAGVLEKVNEILKKRFG